MLIRSPERQTYLKISFFLCSLYFPSDFLEDWAFMQENNCSMQYKLVDTRHFTLGFRAEWGIQICGKIKYHKISLLRFTDNFCTLKQFTIHLKIALVGLQLCSPFKQFNPEDDKYNYIISIKLITLHIQSFKYTSSAWVNQAHHAEQTVNKESALHSVLLSTANKVHVQQLSKQRCIFHFLFPVHNHNRLGRWQGLHWRSLLFPLYSLQTLQLHTVSAISEMNLWQERNENEAFSSSAFIPVKLLPSTLSHWKTKVDNVMLIC